MPYSSIYELPFSVQHALPEHGQRIYMKAYNNAMQYTSTPSMVAWAAVKNVYEKNYDGRWMRRAKVDDYGGDYTSTSTSTTSDDNE
ncbi:ChaB [Betabaculovirus altermyunipunctae]|uniref:ChaB n=1 Tax=Betabaculovirus altermyunipunctae TaxID=3051996 RepID=A0A1S5YE01_9BBAC|nr:ChaB [Betabaculovirus altermyunipunctae]AQQ80363.1 ChaB [Betabaculovirus altermyunipunctae]